jgi:peptidyl-dipeptidase Dcp
MGTAKPNPLLDTSDLEFGAPNFKLFRPTRVREAYMELLRLERKGFADLIEKPATYEDMILGLEQMSDDYHCVHAAFFHLAGVEGTPARNKLATELTKKWMSQASRMYQDPKLFAKVSAVYNKRAKLDPTAQRLTEAHYRTLIDFGAGLPEGDRDKLRRIEVELGVLGLKYNQNLSDEAGAKAMYFSKRDVAGLPADLREDMRRDAIEAGDPNGYALLMTGESGGRFLEYCHNRELRERVWRVYNALGCGGDKFDNTGLVRRMTHLRQRQARLLGFKNFAEMSLRGTMAQTPEQATAVLHDTLEIAARARAQERASLFEFAYRNGYKGKDEPQGWDVSYYARMQRQELIGLEHSQLTPYLEVGNVIKASNQLSERLFGLGITETTIPTYHPDVKILQFNDRKGKHLGLLYVDYYARPGRKADGAWMWEIWPQDGMSDARPILCNVFNITKQPDGKPTFVTLDGAIELFHERGHGLHGLLSNTTYSSLSGTNGPPDYNEMPSQLIEKFLTHPEVMRRYLRHHQTGRPMSASLIDKVQRDRCYRKGTELMYQAMRGLLDLETHQHGDGRADPLTFERGVYQRHGLDPAVCVNPTLASSWQIMVETPSRDYSYIWSEAIAADIFERFEPDPLNARLGRKLEREIMSKGVTRAPEESIRAFLGREPDPKALLRYYGLS